MKDPKQSETFYDKASKHIEKCAEEAHRKAFDYPSETLEERVGVPNHSEYATIIDKMDSEIMNDWFYPIVEILFDKKVVVNSNDLRNILEYYLQQAKQEYKEELLKKIGRLENNDMLKFDPATDLRRGFVDGLNEAREEIIKIINEL